MKALFPLTVLLVALSLTGCADRAPTSLPADSSPGDSPAQGLTTRHEPLVLLGRAMRPAPSTIGGGGFASPLFGLATAPNGDILVADAGAGVSAVTGRGRSGGIPLPGVTDIAPLGRGSMWATTGAGGDPTTDTGQGLHRATNGTSRLIANLFAFEAAYDPDGGDVPDSNPFDVASLGGRAALVVDAGGNSLLRVDRRGNVDVVAVFPSEMVSTANLQGLIGCPDPTVPGLEFICDTPMLPAEAVPTSVAIGPDGYYYVGELKGFPAPTGESRVWRVAPDASWARCGSDPDCEMVLDGFTSIIDLAFDENGTLWVTELDESSWFAVEMGGGTGGSVNACDLAAGTCDVAATGVPLVTAITFGKDGALWHTVNALVPGLADVVRVP